MKRALMTLATIALLSGLAMTLPAETESAPPGSAKRFEARITALLEMPAKERRAHLKGLDREERRGLWRQVMKAKAERRGAQPRTGAVTPLDVTPKKTPMKAVGTIIYDSGLASTSVPGAYVGNRFNTHTGIPVVASGTISTVQAVVVPGASPTSTTAGFVILGPQTTMGNAFSLFNSFATATGVIDTLSFTGLGVNYTGNSFFVVFGNFASDYVPVLGTGTTMGQGHHGVVAESPITPLVGTVAAGITGGSSPYQVTDLTNLNAFVRTRGNIVPVELMSFDVE